MPPLDDHHPAPPPVEMPPAVIRTPKQIQAELAKAREVQEAPAHPSAVAYGEGCVDMYRWLTGLSDEAPSV